jgi:hypothetical protein
LKTFPINYFLCGNIFEKFNHFLQCFSTRIFIKLCSRLTSLFFLSSIVMEEGTGISQV